jgi:type VI secretion system protein ImpA
MTPIDVANLSVALAPEAPAGPDLSFDAKFMELERLAAGTPERRMGDSVIAAEPPDWKAVRQKCLEVLGRTRDLRVMVLLTVAELELDGLEGMRDGLALLRSTVEACWDHVHPQLDPSDGNDPIERRNVLESLSPEADSFGDRLQFIRKLRQVPLARSPRLGRFSLRDLAVARGEAPPPEPGPDGSAAPVVEPATIDAAFDDTPAEDLTAVAAVAESALEEVRALHRVFADKAGTGAAPVFNELEKALREAAGAARASLGRRGLGPAAEGAAGPAGATAAAAAPGEIRSRDDVVATLERVCRFLEANEPSSPIPILLRRAQRLVSKSFVDIVRDLAPGGLGEVEVIGGERYRSE